MKKLQKWKDRAASTLHDSVVLTIELIDRTEKYKALAVKCKAATDESDELRAMLKEVMKDRDDLRERLSTQTLLRTQAYEDQDDLRKRLSTLSANYVKLLERCEEFSKKGPTKPVETFTEKDDSVPF